MVDDLSDLSVIFIFIVIVILISLDDSRAYCSIVIILFKVAVGVYTTIRFLRLSLFSFPIGGYSLRFGFMLEGLLALIVAFCYIGFLFGKVKLDRLVFDVAWLDQTDNSVLVHYS